MKEQFDTPEQALIPYTASGAFPARSVLVFAPHADDEVFGCGGTLALYAQASTPVRVIVVTDGAFGLEGAAHLAIMEQREAESQAAAACLGYNPPEFWRLPDRGLQYNETLIARILQSIDETKADWVYAPSLWEVSPDHRVLALAVMESVRRRSQAARTVTLAFYEVGAPLRPNRLVDISTVFPVKQAAMALFASQLATQAYGEQLAALNRYRAYTLPREVTAAEAFEIYTAAELLESPGMATRSEYQRRRNLGMAMLAHEIPRVSIMIRSMDRPCLSDALDSIALSTWPNIDVVVVSARGPAHRPLEPQCGPYPLKLVLPEAGPEGIGRSQAANLCLDAADGDYLLFLDDDDRIDPDHIASLVAAATATNQSAVAYSGIRVEDEHGRVIDIYSEPVFERQRLLLTNFLPIHAVLFPRQATRHCHFDPALPVYEDWDFWLQVSECVPFRPTGQISAVYRAFLGNSGLSDDEKIRREGRQRLLSKWSAAIDTSTLLAFAGTAMQKASNSSAGLARRIAELENRIAEQDNAAKQNGIENSRLETRIKEQDHENKEREGYIGKLETDVHFWMGEAKRLNAERIIQEEKAWAGEHTIRELETQLTELRANTASLHNKLERSGHAHQLSMQRIHALFSTLQTLLTSRVWRGLQPALKAGAKLRGRGAYSSPEQVLLQVSQQSGPGPVDSEHVQFQAIDGRLPLLFRHLSLTSLPVPALPEMVDIIIPVYNGFEYLGPLLNSLESGTPQPHRLILIDDCSSDTRVWPVLQQFAEKRLHVVLLRNPSNLGFVQTVNRGVGISRHHVVLLNTDVEVPPNWLPRLMQPILADPRVASATPFTNSGTICSFPDFCTDNPIYRNLSVTEVDHFFSRVLMPGPGNEYDIPTGVGFCMAINRAAIESIGMFDAENFGRGYGEENDWCLRAGNAGFRHVLAPNLFVFHKHGASFSSEEKQRLIEQNLRRLNELHPGYDTLIRKYVAADPLRPLRQLLQLVITAHMSNKKPTLIFDHNLGGGANHYRRERVAERLAEGMSALVYYEHFGSGEKKLEVHLDADHAFTLVSSGRNDLYDLICHIPLSEIIYNEAVFYSEPQTVPSLLRQLKNSTQARLSVLLHDYYPICPSYTLLNDQNYYCGVPENMDVCQACLPNNHFMQIASDPCTDILLWRKEWNDALAEADEIVAFSKASADIFQRAYPHCTKHLVVRPHQIPKLTTDKQPIRSTPLHIGVVGAINLQKGSEIVAKMLHLIQAQALPIKISIIGDTDHPDLKKTITVTGRYEVAQLPKIMDDLGVNFAFLPSIWPETFSYVTSELISLGFPFACFNLGAPAERVSCYENGLVISQVDAKIALTEIQAFHSAFSTGTASKKVQSFTGHSLLRESNI